MPYDRVACNVVCSHQCITGAGVHTAHTAQHRDEATRENIFMCAHKKHRVRETEMRERENNKYFRTNRKKERKKNIQNNTEHWICIYAAYVAEDEKLYKVETTLSIGFICISYLKMWTRIGWCWSSISSLVYTLCVRDIWLNVVVVVWLMWVYSFDYIHSVQRDHFGWWW